MFSRSSQFDRSLEKATSQLLLEPDWDSVLQICDCIRQGDVQPKYAVGAIKRKIGSDNPHVSLFALQLLESCVKNCGASIHQEIATKEFMEFMKDQAKARTETVKNKILELIQVWSQAFRNEVNYKVVQDTYHLMKMEGYTFPTLKEADAMFMADSAPDWKDGDCCTRCRVLFGMMQRKHHCRNCGEIYCGKCSAKSSILPKFGIEKEVRVCDACFDKLNKSGGKKDDDSLPAEYLASPLSKQSQEPAKKSDQDIQEEEELQLALALSQSEQETKEKERNRYRDNYSGTSNDRSSSPQASRSVYVQPAAVNASNGIDTSDMDPELARYLNRNYWQQKSDEVKSVVYTTTPSAPVATTDPVNTSVKTEMSILTQNGDTEADQAQFLNALQGSIEIFINRMRSNSQRGRNIANDSSVQSLFTVISNMHPHLMKQVQEQEDLRGHYESLQDKLAQLRDAREALNALREDHQEKRRREQEELERQRQIQMAQKLDIMRQKKHEYLEVQRQLALQRLQEQEREMQMRFEQQKQLTQIRQMQAYGYPQHMSHGVPHGFSPGGSVDGSPVHQLQQQGAGYLNQGMTAPGQVAPPGGMAPVQPPAYGQPGQQQMYRGPPMNQPAMVNVPYQAPVGAMPPTGMPGGGIPTQSVSMAPVGIQGGGMPTQGVTMAPTGVPGQMQAQEGMSQTGGGMPPAVVPGGMPPSGGMNAGYQPPGDQQLAGSGFQYAPSGQPHGVAQQGYGSLPSGVGQQGSLPSGVGQQGSLPSGVGQQSSLPSGVGQQGSLPSGVGQQDYQAFSMQSISNSLPPQQNQPTYSAPQPQFTGAPAPQQQMYQQQVPTPAAPQPQQQNQSHETELISFD